MSADIADDVWKVVGYVSDIDIDVQKVLDDVVDIHDSKAETPIRA